MTRQGKLFSIAAAFLLAAFVSCEQPAGPGTPQKPPPEAAMTGMWIAGDPEIKDYAKGQAFDPRGLVVMASYDDGIERPLNAGEYTLSEVNTALQGVKTITVRAGSFTDKFYVYVRNSTSVLNSITFAAPPSKLNYEFGQNLDTSGMVLTGNYFDSATGQTSQEPVNLFSVTIQGYDKTWRGEQNITVLVNGKKLEDVFAVRVRVPASAALATNLRISAKRGDAFKFPALAFAKGQALSLPGDFTVTVTANGSKRTFSGREAADCLSSANYNPAVPGTQALAYTIDDKTANFYVVVLEAEPELFFDYGFMRHQGDLDGYGPNKAGWDADGGRYYVRPDQKLVIAPVRFLLGSDNFTWTVTRLEGPGTGTPESLTGEYLRFSADDAGVWEVTVTTAGGKNVVTGAGVTSTATTRIICSTENLPPGTPLPTGGDADLWFLKNYSPGQFTESGTGLGWSLGGFGGYAAWELDRDQSSVYIRGNAFGSWLEPGVVWVMKDDNGNGMPDETWYELRGSAPESRISRRTAVKYFQSEDEGVKNQYGQIIKAVWYVDAAGTTGGVEAGWSGRWGVEGGWVIYSGTLLLGPTDGMTGYVDTATIHFNVSDAVYPDGSPVSGLGPIRFVKVHTGIFSSGGAFGEISTEIYAADTIGQITDFPLPAGAY